jgi:hypothetical protein
MTKLISAAVMALAVAVYAAAAVGHDGGGGDHGDRHRGGTVRLPLAPSLPSDPAFHSVTAGGVPWLLRRGDARIKMRGRLEVEVRGLVIPNPPGDGTAGPVKTVSASLYCGADSDATAADTTPATPLSSSGNAKIKDKSFNVPATCLAPIVLIHPNGDATRYIAVSGWRR